MAGEWPTKSVPLPTKLPSKTLVIHSCVCQMVKYSENRVNLNKEVFQNTSVWPFDKHVEWITKVLDGNFVGSDTDLVGYSPAIFRIIYI